MDILQLVVLSIMQGVTEFLPISSSAHVILTSELLKWQDQGLVFDAAVNIGTLFAIVFYLRKDLILLTKGGFSSLIGKKTENSKIAWCIVFSTLPAVFFGLILKRFELDEKVRSIQIIIATTLFFGVLMGCSDYFGKKNLDLSYMTTKKAIAIGLMQALSLIPGTSRSGITMTMALFLGFKRDVAAKFSFLLSVPITLGACIFVFLDLFNSNTSIDWLTLISATFISGLSAFGCVYVFFGFINRIGLMPFVCYRLVLGIILASLFYTW